MLRSIIRSHTHARAAARFRHVTIRTFAVGYEIPRRIKQKVVTAEDAVSLVQAGDTVAVSGFVCQGVPEGILRALANRYAETGQPNNLTIFFGGGPGDWDWRGLNHLAQRGTDGNPPMLARTIGSHYGQVPKVAELALANEVEAWTLPMGSVSRMWRAQSTRSPGHLTTVGLGTCMDPDLGGGCANDKARQSKFQPIAKVHLDGEDQLLYRALPIHVAIIRGTTADAQGNITIEQESLNVDQRICAAAARNSGGLVIAQVTRLAANNTLPAKSVVVPGSLVDCVVVIDPADADELHPMSFMERYNPACAGAIRSPFDAIPKAPHDIRKLIARRAFFNLKPNTMVNLGIGLPEGVANVAAEEGLLEYITLSTEPGVFGGLPCGGHSFGPAVNPAALIEMNEMFDFYDGGGLDICFLGAAQVSKEGNVNVSRMSADRLTGPGGFINISQSTGNIVFMTPFTTKGLDIDTTQEGELQIKQEGKVKKFVDEVFEVTFSGEEAVRRGQNVFYVTERAVFRRTANHKVLELIEIAPGIDLQKDVLDQIDFKPAVAKNLKIMDKRIFQKDAMKVGAEMFGSLEERAKYHEDDHTLYLDLFGITLGNDDDVNWFFGALRGILTPLCAEKGPIHMVANYDGFDLGKGLEEKYVQETQALQADFYKSAKRYSGKAFHRAKLGNQIKVVDWDPAKLFTEFDINGDGRIQRDELRDGMYKKFLITLSPKQLEAIFQNNMDGIDHKDFAKAVKELLMAQDQI
eukprot:scaffold3912_cov136-Amphora_coffeaeformis.AAC.1